MQSSLMQFNRQLLAEIARGSADARAMKSKSCGTKGDTTVPYGTPLALY